MPPTVLVQSTVDVNGQGFGFALLLSPPTLPPTLLLGAFPQLHPLVPHMVPPSEDTRQVRAMAVVVGLDAMREV